MRDAIEITFTVTVREMHGWSGTELAERRFTVGGEMPALLCLELGEALQRTLNNALGMAVLAQREAEDESE